MKKNIVSKTVNKAEIMIVDPLRKLLFLKLKMSPISFNLGTLLLLLLQL